MWGLIGSLCISLYQFYLSRGHWMLWQNQTETDPTDPQTHPSNVEAWLTSPWHHSTKTLRQAVNGSLRVLYPSHTIYAYVLESLLVVRLYLNLEYFGHVMKMCLQCAESSASLRKFPNLRSLQK